MEIVIDKHDLKKILATYYGIDEDNFNVTTLSVDREHWIHVGITTER